MNTTTLTLNQGGYFTRRSAFDWAMALLVAAATAFAFSRYSTSMDIYEKWILIGTAPCLIALLWFWPKLRTLSLWVGGASLLALYLYGRTSDGFGADLAAADKVFGLKYFLSSQSAILWSCVLFFMSTAFYWIGFFVKAQNNTAQVLGSRLAWVAVFAALVGTLVRWFESHQIAPDIGHIPVSNLYEVFVLFCWLTTLFYLWFEQRYQTYALGAFGSGTRWCARRMKSSPWCPPCKAGG
jgi:hypothetical protein